MDILKLKVSLRGFYVNIRMLDFINKISIKSLMYKSKAFSTGM